MLQERCVAGTLCCSTAKVFIPSVVQLDVPQHYADSVTAQLPSCPRGKFQRQSLELQSQCAQLEAPNCVTA